jgi:hypothetical protein
MGTHTQGASEREFVLGQELRATILATAEETDGHVDLMDCVQPPGTPAHLATPETGLDADLFMAVTTRLGDVVLGPPGTTPAELADRGPE